MIYKDGKEVTSLFRGNQAIATVYRGALVVWQAVRSCFGRGMWINEKPWNSEDGWKNND